MRGETCGDNPTGDDIMLRFTKCPRCREGKLYDAIDNTGLYSVCVLCKLLIRDQELLVRHHEGLHPQRYCA